MSDMEPRVTDELICENCKEDRINYLDFGEEEQITCKSCGNVYYLNRVIPEFACPDCKEDRADFLRLEEYEERVTCHSCSNVYYLPNRGESEWH